MKSFLKNNIYLILVLVLSVPSVWALFHPGFYGASDDLHVAWLFEMDKILKLGQIPPRFVPDLSFGFGYPLFNFVFPLPFYLGELFHLIGFSLVDSVKIVFGISLAGSAVLMYLFLEEIISKHLAAVGALIYLYTPYRATDVYIRGAIGESLAFVFLPLTLYSVVRKNIPLLAIAVSGLILSHNIVSYMFFPFVLFFILLKFSWKNVIGVILGLLISAYFWVPAILESSLMKYSTVFNFADHFPTIRQLVTPFFGYGASVPGSYDGMSFFMGLVNLAVIIVGAVFGIIKWRSMSKMSRSVMVVGALMLSVSLFMMNFRSSFLWQNLPLLPYFQFPWRFLTITTLSSILFLIPFNLINGKWNYVLAAALGVGVVAINAGYFKPHDFLEREDAYYINRYIPTPAASSDYKNTQEEYLRLPKDTRIRPDKNFPLITSDKKFDYTVIETNGIYSKINIEVPDDMAINYNKYNFPGWRAEVDGVETEIKSAEPYGQISLNVPKGGHVLEFDFKETPLRSVLNLISLSTLIGVSVMFAADNFIKRRIIHK